MPTVCGANALFSKELAGAEPFYAYPANRPPVANVFPCLGGPPLFQFYHTCSTKQGQDESRPHNPASANHQREPCFVCARVIRGEHEAAEIRLVSVMPQG